MCRNIKKLRQPDRYPTPEELLDASLQFIRKISGFRVPSERNREAFDKAVHEVATVSGKLFKDLQIQGQKGGAMGSHRDAHGL
jgi:hypothetical protein